ncbi:hypothetical protein BN938_2691 [Mucinivorans hirudinis]|uniref:Uncharacterized protein n=1 Tax=Mucinivorans hirudinis TaxID=1433126 RepID=A0A060RAU9_9BACT|nr:hypothetical protein BN938_2691 [Mucinivorans hirudinis]
MAFKGRLYNSHLYVLDRSSKKLNKYTTNGNFVENYNLDDFYSHFYIIDDKLAFMSSECANKSGKNFTLYNYIDNTVVESFDNFPDVEFYLSTITPFNPTNSGQMLITKDFDNSVYLLNDNSLDAIFSFNFNTKVNFEEKEKGVPSIQTLDRLQNQELVQRIEIIYTTDDFIFITFPIFYSDLGKRWHIAKINRKDKQVKLVRIADEIDHVVPFLSFPPLAIYDDWVVMAVPPVLVLERDSNFAKILSEYDNPVLFFNKLSK